MGNWHLSVPKIAHFYWGGGPLLYIRYLSVLSFMRQNPDWNVILWYPKNPFKGKSWGIQHGDQDINYRLCKDYTPELTALPINKIPIDFDSLGFTKNMAEVHKNDYVRISVLGMCGGVWSDTDVIFFRPMSDLKVNIPENEDKETYVCISWYGHSTGFNMANEGSRFFESLFSKLRVEYKKKEYQCWGPDLFNKYYKTLESIPSAINLSMDVVYTYDCHHVGDLLKDEPQRFTEGSIGCHWYGGNSIWGKFLNQTGGGVKNLPKCVISDLINGV